MDTEEHIEIQNSLSQRRLPAEIAAMLHDARQEKRQSGVRSYLFRTAVYTGVGAVIGATAAATTLLIFPDTPDAPALSVAGIMAAGALYGTYKALRLCRIGRWFKHRRDMAKGADKPKESFSPTPVITVVYPSHMADFPASDTYSRDKLAAAKLALLNLDPAKTVRQ